MIRTLSSVAAVVSAALLAPTLAQAADTGPYYVATPVAAPAKTVLITGETVWKWNNAAFTAGTSTRRDAIMCEMLVQRTGKLAAFTAAGKAFDDAALSKCNARAK